MSTTLTMNKSRLKLGGRRANTYTGRKARRVKSSAPRSVFGIIKTVTLMVVLLAFLAGLSTGCLYGYRWITSHPYFAVKRVDVAGTARTTRSAIMEAAGLSMGVNSLSLNVSDVEQGVSSLPWVASATVRRELPGTLWIKVKERVPAFWVRTGDRYSYADQTGKVIAPVTPGDFASLPVLEVDPGSRFAAELLPALIERIREPKGPFDLARAAWIKLDQAGDLEIFLDKENLTLRMHASNWQQQLDRMGVVRADLAERGELRQAAVISAGKDKIWIKRRS